jgi:hypothetical protein
VTATNRSLGPAGRAGVLRGTIEGSTAPGDQAIGRASVQMDGASVGVSRASRAAWEWTPNRWKIAERWFRTVDCET